MATKYFVDLNGNYLGGYVGAEPPLGSIEVQFPPKDGRSKWNGSSWEDPIIPKEESIKVELIKQGFTHEERISALEALAMKNDSTKADQIQAIKDAK